MDNLIKQVGETLSKTQKKNDFNIKKATESDEQPKFTQTS
jgi:hypothetical protein